MNLEAASVIYDTITKDKYERDADFVELRNQLIEKAIEYARIRVDWKLKNREDRIKMDARRTAIHNDFINSCNILSRFMDKKNMDNTWREKLTDDRKVIGDFACYLHCILGLTAR